MTPDDKKSDGKEELLVVADDEEEEVLQANLEEAIKEADRLIIPGEESSSSEDGFSFDSLALDVPEGEVQPVAPSEPSVEGSKGAKSAAKKKVELLDLESDELVDVTRKKRKWWARIAFDRNLNERGIIGESFSQLKEVLEDYGYHAIEFSNVLLQSKLFRYDIFIFACPDYVKLNPVEIKNLVRYVRNGGSLILLSNAGGDRGRGTNLNELSKEFGITFNNDQVIDDVNNNGINTMPMISNFATHPIMKGVKEICYRSGCSLEPTSAASPLAFAETIAEPTNANVIASSEVDLGKVICVGAYEMFRNEILKWFYHEKLFMNMIEWALNKKKDHIWIQAIDMVNFIMSRGTTKKPTISAPPAGDRGARFEMPVLPTVSKGEFAADDLQFLIDAFNEVLITSRNLEAKFEQLKSDITVDISELQGFNLSITRELADIGLKLEDIKDFENGLNNLLMDLGKNVSKLLKKQAKAEPKKEAEKEPEKEPKKEAKPAKKAKREKKPARSKKS